VASGSYLVSLGEYAKAASHVVTASLDSDKVGVGNDRSFLCGSLLVIGLI